MKRLLTLILLACAFLAAWYEPVLERAIVLALFIGLSVVYKAFENMGGFRAMFGFQPNTRAAVNCSIASRSLDASRAYRTISG